MYKVEWKAVAWVLCSSYQCVGVRAAPENGSHQVRMDLCQGGGFIYDWIPPLSSGLHSRRTFFSNEKTPDCLIRASGAAVEEETNNG